MVSLQDESLVIRVTRVSTNPYQAPTAIDDSESIPVRFDPSELMATAFGLRLIYFGVLTLLLTFVFLILSKLILGFSLPSVLLPAAGGIGALLTVTGPVCCLTVPAQTGLRPCVVAAIASPVLSITAGFVGMAIGVFRPFWLIGICGWLVGSLFFLGLLIRLARHVGRIDLSKQARYLMIGGVSFFLITIPLGVFVGSPSPSVSIIVAAGVGIVYLILFVSFIHLILSLANAIRSPTKNSS